MGAEENKRRFTGKYLCFHIVIAGLTGKIFSRFEFFLLLKYLWGNTLSVYISLLFRHIFLHDHFSALPPLSSNLNINHQDRGINHTHPLITTNFPQLNRWHISTKQLLENSFPHQRKYEKPPCEQVRYHDWSCKSFIYTHNSLISVTSFSE